MPSPLLLLHSWLHRRRLSPDTDLLAAPPRAASVVKPGVQRLIDAYREQGSRCASLDPLDLARAESAQTLAPARFGLRPGDTLSSDGSAVLGVRLVQELETRLQAVYCGTLSLDASAVRDASRRAWLYAQMEALPSAAAVLRARGAELLGRLVAVQGWEQFLAEQYPQAKRFSLEGCEALLPLLDALIEQASARGVGEVFLGMPHRGRVNVLVNLMGMPARELLDYFEYDQPAAEGKRDLVYHLGGQHVLRTLHGEVALTLAYNPSHLQSVQPVVVGMARAAQDRSQQHLPGQALAIVMHGDAAFAGQGVVMETLVMSQKAGYSVGGAVHVIINNQVGFTEPNPMDGQQPRYCTDVSRMIDAPVLRVSADAPEQMQRAAEIALAYRSRYAADIFIDLIGYRRLGHSEHDVPALTSPARQQRIAQAPGVVGSFAARLQAAGGVDAAELARQIDQARARALLRFTQSERRPTTPSARQVWPAAPLPTQPELHQLVQRLTWLPEGFVPHPMVQTLIEDWQAMAADAQARVDWRFAENLAYASVLTAGVGVRISGMDVRRGTFFHRQAVWHGQQAPGAGAPAEITPLAALQEEGARFDVVNSPLAEEAVLGFEYGFSLQAARRLVIWEAQFGDFVNGAQVYADQYIASGEAKWGCASGLTLLLPHGYEGVGPEHSNGFLARFLQLCAEDNLRVVYPSSSAQLYHLLRRQALDAQRKPLIVMTPKAVLYEEAESHSPLQALTQGGFETVLDEASPEVRARAERLVLCSGKLYYELVRGRRAEGGRSRTALLRLEQLYPFPREALAALLSPYSQLQEIVWAQEEQLNQGAWAFIRDELQALCPPDASLRCVAPPSTATGATASLATHKRTQHELVAQALGQMPMAG